MEDYTKNNSQFSGAISNMYTLLFCFCLVTAEILLGMEQVIAKPNKQPVWIIVTWAEILSKVSYLNKAPRSSSVTKDSRSGFYIEKSKSEKSMRFCCIHSIFPKRNKYLGECSVCSINFYFNPKIPFTTCAKIRGYKWLQLVFNPLLSYNLFISSSR